MTIKSIEQFYEVLEKTCPHCTICEEINTDLCLRKFDMICPKCGKTFSINGEDSSNFFDYNCSECQYKEEFPISLTK